MLHYCHKLAVDLLIAAYITIFKKERKLNEKQINVIQNVFYRLLRETDICIDSQKTSSSLFLSQLNTRFHANVSAPLNMLKEDKKPNSQNTFHKVIK